MHQAIQLGIRDILESNSSYASYRGVDKGILGGGNPDFQMKNTSCKPNFLTKRVFLAFQC